MLMHVDRKNKNFPSSVVKKCTHIAGTDRETACISSGGGATASTSDACLGCNESWGGSGGIDSIFNFIHSLEGYHQLNNVTVKDGPADALLDPDNKRLTLRDLYQFYQLLEQQDTIQK